MRSILLYYREYKVEFLPGADRWENLSPMSSIIHAAIRHLPFAEPTQALTQAASKLASILAPLLHPIGDHYEPVKISLKSSGDFIRIEVATYVDTSILSDAEAMFSIYLQEDAPEYPVAKAVADAFDKAVAAKN